MTRGANKRKQPWNLAVIADVYPGDAILEGICDALAEHPAWQLLKSARGFTHRSEHIPFVEADGYVLYYGLPPERKEALLRKAKPVVGIGVHHDFPCVRTGNEAANRLAAEHLLAAGYRHFGHLYADAAPGNEATGPFERHLAQAGYPVVALDLHGISVFRQWPLYRERLAALLRQVPKPIGIFCETDFRAIPLVRICLELGIAVPHEVGVIGVQDLRHEPDLLPISLTSVMTNDREIGRQLVRLLDRLARGQPAESVLVPPAGIKAGVTTDVSLAPDPLVAKCLEILRKRLSEGWRVTDLAREVHLTTRMLQLRFLKAVGQTPFQAIESFRLRSAQQLLAGTDLTVTEIATACGCSDVRGLCVMFKRNTGLTPSEYRQKHRAA